jgi:hypothetical protein
MLPVMRKPTAAVPARYENRAEHARFWFKHKPRTDRCFLLIGAKRQTIFRIFRLPLGPAVCGRFSSLAQSRDQQQRKENTMSKPSHHAYVVSTPKKQGANSIWTRIGSVFPHKNGDGFDVLIREGISVTGRIVCTETKDRDDE